MEKEAEENERLKTSHFKLKAALEETENNISKLDNVIKNREDELINELKEQKELVEKLQKEKLEADELANKTIKKLKKELKKEKEQTKQPNGESNGNGTITSKPLNGNGLNGDHRTIVEKLLEETQKVRARRLNLDHESRS